jgi:rSAM/selenodomain-associated transferase 1
MSNENSLIIIAKYPEKENVMTRLKDKMTDEERLRLYESLLQQTVHKLKSIPGVDTCIAFAPPDSEEYFLNFGVHLIPLPAGDLGIRMFHAFKEVFIKGYARAALVGVDIPDLSGSIITRAFKLLSVNDLVFGPANDGGYYMVGMSSLVKEVFEDVPWSTEETLQSSLDKAGHYGYSVGFTETLSDIDTVKDLKNLDLISAEYNRSYIRCKTNNHSHK